MAKSSLLVLIALAAAFSAVASEQPTNAQPADAGFPEQPAVWRQTAEDNDGAVQSAVGYIPELFTSQDFLLVNGQSDLESSDVELSGYCDSAEDCADGSCGHCSTCGHAGCSAERSRFYVQADAALFELDNESRDQAAVIDVNTLASLIRTTDPAFDVEAAVRLLAGYRINCATAVEVVYFGPLEWEDSLTASGLNNLGIPGDLGLASLDFFGADVMQVTYTSELDNLEFNVARCSCCCEAIEFLAGFRYLTLDETFNINSTDFDTGVSDYNIQTRNTLYGGQLGLRMRHCLPWVRLEATSKAGIFSNDAEQTQSVNDFPPPFQLRPQQTAGSSGTAFVGELTFAFTVPLNDCWGLRAGYNLLWIDDVALAADQLDFTNTPTSGSIIDDKGRAFLHGAIVGVERSW